jgi:hypothetical protein
MGKNIFTVSRYGIATAVRPKALPAVGTFGQTNGFGLTTKNLINNQVSLCGCCLVGTLLELPGSDQRSDPLSVFSSTGKNAPAG